MRARALTAACMLLGGLGLAARADDRPLDRTELDKRAARVAYDSAALGTDLWRAKNYEGCFRLYQGSLMALQPMLDHRPKLAALVQDRLEKVERMRAEEGAFVLREALDAVQKDTQGALVAPKKDGTPEKKDGEAGKKVLWERLGGEKAVRVVVKDFVAAAAADPKVNFTRDGRYKLDAKGVDRLEQLIVEQISAATGGPLKYTGRDMKTAHAGMKITDDEFAALAGHLAVTLVKHRVAVADVRELLELVGSAKKDIVGQ